MTSASPSPPLREVRAVFGPESIRVYQAFSSDIADGALSAQTFVPPFSRSRMTWIKPSFCWMAYRSGWARSKGQERVLGIDISRPGFEWALEHSCATAFDPDLHADPDSWRALLQNSPVRIQWDPERTVALQPLSWRTIQIGLSPAAVQAYVEDWIKAIDDMTPLVRQIEALVKAGDRDEASALLPRESRYPLADALERKIGTTPRTNPGGLESRR